MNLIRYCENQFQEVRLELHNLELEEKYSDWKDAEIKALHSTLTRYRQFLKFIQIPLIFVKFLFVNLGLLREPRPVMQELIKKQKVAEAAAKKLIEEAGADPKADAPAPPLDQ